MKKQSSFFVIFCLCLALGLMSVYNLFVSYFDGHQQFQRQLIVLEEKVEKEKLKNSLLSYQIKDFQQTVAQALPDKKEMLAKNELQNFASVVRIPASEDQIDLSSVLFEKGMKFYNNRNYDKAINQFHEMVEKYPLSPHNVEAHFFSAESYFQQKEYKNCLTEVDLMLSQYPDNDLTGFILLRMGRISELNNQPEEAREIYKVVSLNFKNDKLVKQAQGLLQGVQ